MAFSDIEKNSAYLLLKKRLRGLFYALSLIILLLLILSSIYGSLYDHRHEKRKIQQFHELTKMQSTIIDEINSAGIDLVYFAHNELAFETLSSQESSAKGFLTSLMLKIGTLQQRYDQIRLLDVDGNEVLRLNQNEDQTMWLAPEEQLQNKRHRYYFTESTKLFPNQLYISKFDLNMEQGKVERPLKPMLRFSTPIHNRSGERLGFGVLNYKGQHLFNLLDILNIHQGDQIFLLSEQGYYLKSPYPNTEWGFILPERIQSKFQARHPMVWEEIQQHQTGEIITNEGEFYFTTFTLSLSPPLNAIQGEKVTLIMHVPNVNIHHETMLLLKGLALAFLVLTPVLGFLGYKLGHYQIKQSWLFKKMEFEARHDHLTGLYNRKAIIEILTHNILINNRRHSHLSVGFIDVNDLKIMNDQYGHDMGDELIKGVAKAIREVIRGSDAAARIGGDEFLIMFVDCNEKGAHIIMERIDRIFTSLGTAHSEIPWSMSYGCTTLLDEQDTADKMIERADNQMYRHKKRLKELKAAGRP